MHFLDTASRIRAAARYRFAIDFFKRSGCVMVRGVEPAGPWRYCKEKKAYVHKPD